MKHKNDNDGAVVTTKQYEKLVAKGRRLLKGGLHWHNVEKRLRVAAKSMISPRVPSRAEHAEDIASQAISDVCRGLGVAHLLDEEHENEPIVNKPFSAPAEKPRR